MRVFMTGGTGYVGAHIVKALTEADHEVSILARNPDKIPTMRRLRGVSFVVGDLEDPGLLVASLPGHQALIHNALVWDVDGSDLDLKDLRCSVQLFETAASSGVEHTIYTSSTAVHRPFKAVMDERSRITTSDSYGATKACGEIFLSAISHRFDMRCNVVRLGPVVGAPGFPDAPWKSDRRFLEFAKAAREGEPIQIVRGDERQLIGASDAAKVYLALLESNLNRESFISVSRGPTTWESIAKEIVRGCESSSEVIADEGAHCGSTLFDVSKLSKAFGFDFDSASGLTEHIRHLLVS